MGFDFDFAIKLILIINIVLGFSVNLSSAAQGLKSTATITKKKPKTWLQSYPKNISLIIFLILIISIFVPYGKFSYQNLTFDYIRIGFAFFYVILYWFQVWSFKSLKEFYTQDIVIFQGQKIIQSGPYSIVRHPIYLSEILMDFAAGIALQSYVILALTLLLELPILKLRADYEEKLLLEYLPQEYKNYSSKVSKWIPFIY